MILPELLCAALPPAAFRASLHFYLTRSMLGANLRGSHAAGT
jgi:hypothetical protein